MVAASLVGDNEPLHMLYRLANGVWRGDQIGESGSSAPTIVAFSGRRPVIAYRDPQAVSVARPSFAGTYALRDGAQAGLAPELARVGLARRGARAR